MANNFQQWLMSEGYTREHGESGAWLKDGIVVSAKELSDKLEEWKSRIFVYVNVELLCPSCKSDNINERSGYHVCFDCGRHF